MPRSAPTPAEPPDPDAPRALAARLADLAVAFGKVGLFGFGGGPSFIPLIQREVEAHRWLSREAFLDAFAFGNALPGPIATKLAGYVGYRVAGWPGAWVALLALTVPTILAMVGLATLYVQHQDGPWVAGFLTGLRPVVIGLLLYTVVVFAPGALGPLRAWRSNLLRWGLAVAAFVAAVVLGVHPGLLILAGGVAGIALRRPA
ncbi:MAG: chromate transporter [Trueperaceae bacterium]|nr:chromate transporter [Trueperaceae bacterium]